MVDTVRSIIEPTPAGEWHSVALYADGSDGIEKGLICSFPIRSDGTKVEIVQDLPLNKFSRAKIETSVAELKEERTMVGDLIPTQGKFGTTRPGHKASLTTAEDLGSRTYSHYPRVAKSRYQI